MAAVRVADEFFPSRPPDYEGVIQSVSAESAGPYRYTLRLRVAPYDRLPPPQNADQEHFRRMVGDVTVHITSSTRVHGQPPGGPQVGQRARVWVQRDAVVLATFPSRQI